MNQDDTIAAIATAPGEAGLCVIRVSGPDCFRIADDIFRCPAPPPSQRPGSTFVHGRVVHNDTVLDDALLLIMRTPHSYTGDDTVEIQGHGGSASSRRLLRCVLDHGARLAEPGEFTKRAFLNGRLDLTQAEAVLDLIRAKTDLAADSAIEQLEGRIKSTITTIYDFIVSVAADLEATMDFPEDELPAPVVEDIIARLAAGVRDLSGLYSTWEQGHKLRDGVLVVISGKPNVGKSTLLNDLLGIDRAIVSHIPGTTRDTIEENLLLDGFTVRLVDTAGLRETYDHIEGEGIRRSRDWLNRAQIQIYVVDASRELDEYDQRHIASLSAESALIVLNKCDLGVRATLPRADTPSVAISLKSGNAGAVKAALAKLISGSPTNQAIGHATISLRHRGLVQTALTETNEAVAIVRSRGEAWGMLASEHLRGALESLGMITGRVYNDDLLDSIFSRFCIGK